MRKNIDTNELEVLKSKGIDLASIAKAIGWSKRRDGLISVEAFFQSILAATSVKEVSFNKIAALCCFRGIAVSRQAVAKRVARGSADLLQAVFERVAAAAVSTGPAEPVCGFKRVVLQDGTSMKLPDKLASVFPTTCRGKATIKAQAYLDLGSQRLLRMAASPHSKNDQSFSEDALEVGRPGDLLVRDLGYFSLKAFARLTAAGVELLSRYKSDTRAFTEDGDEVDLVEELSGREQLDLRLRFGDSMRMPLRLVAFRLPDALAEQRLRRVNADARKRGRKPTARAKRLARWQIYLTSCSAQRLSAEQVHGLYRQRWSIEMFFKTMKSHLRLADIPAYASGEMCRCLVLGSFIKAAAMALLVAPLSLLAKARDRFVSPMKLLGILELAFARGCLAAPGPIALDIQEMLRYCAYDKRKRKSLPELLHDMSLG